MQQLGLFWLAAQRSLFSIEKLPLKDRQGLTSGGKYSLDEVEVTHCSRPKSSCSPSLVGFSCLFWLFPKCFKSLWRALLPKEHPKPISSPALKECGQLADRRGLAVLWWPSWDAAHPHWSCPREKGRAALGHRLLSSNPLSQPGDQHLLPQPCGPESPGRLQHINKSRLTLE